MAGHQNPVDAFNLFGGVKPITSGYPHHQGGKRKPRVRVGQAGWGGGQKALQKICEHGRKLATFCSAAKVLDDRNLSILGDGRMRMEMTTQLPVQVTRVGKYLRGANVKPAIQLYLILP